MTHEQAVEKHAAERYLLDEMPELERFAFEEHLFDCAICAEDVRAGAIMQEGVKAGLLPQDRGQEAGGRREEGGNGRPASAEASPGTQAPSPRPQAPPGWRVAVPWAVAAMLTVAVGYQALWVVPGLREQVMGPSVLSPVTLRGASRGAAPTLTRPASGAIALAVDLADVAAGTRLTYDLRAADGRSVASGTAAAPPPGTPLLLLIPASALQSAGGYLLAVRSGDGPGSAAVDYRLTITDP
jgi:anti-sigma factor RsiW